MEASARSYSRVSIDDAFHSTLDPRHCCIVFFDLETGGFRCTDDILQISARHGDRIFNEYASPTQAIEFRSTDVHGLWADERGNLRHGHRIVPSNPLKFVLQNLLEFLQEIGEPCVLVAHNCNFDSTRLLYKLEEFALTDEFREVIAGFACSLRLFRERFPERKGAPNAFQLTTLTRDLLKRVPQNAHNAEYDVKLLAKLFNEYFAPEDLINRVEGFDSAVEKIRKKEESKPYLTSLRPLEGVVSKAMLERMAYGAITYESIVREMRKGEEYATEFLERKIHGKPTIIKSKRILNKILDHIESEILQ